MKTSDNQSSIWTTKVIVPAVAIIALGIATAISDDIKAFLGIHHQKVPKQTSADTIKHPDSNPPVSLTKRKVTIRLRLTNKTLPLKGDTVIFDKNDILATDDAGVCFKEMDAGILDFYVHAYSKTFHYTFDVPYKPDSLCTMAQDIDYVVPITTASIPDTAKKITTINPAQAIYIARALKLPPAKKQIQVLK